MPPPLVVIARRTYRPPPARSSRARTWENRRRRPCPLTEGAVVSPSYLMPDVIVCIPGITGSVLRKNGRDVWNISGSAVFNALRTLGGNLHDLELEEDPIDVDDVDG